MVQLVAKCRWLCVAGRCTSTVVIRQAVVSVQSGPVAPPWATLWAPARPTRIRPNLARCDSPGAWRRQAQWRLGTWCARSAESSIPTTATMSSANGSCCCVCMVTLVPTPSSSGRWKFASCHDSPSTASASNASLARQSALRTLHQRLPMSFTCEWTDGRVLLVDNGMLSVVGSFHTSSCYNMYHANQSNVSQSFFVSSRIQSVPDCVLLRHPWPKLLVRYVQILVFLITHFLRCANVLLCVPLTMWTLRTIVLVSEVLTRFVNCTSP